MYYCFINHTDAERFSVLFTKSSNRSPRAAKVSGILDKLVKTFDLCAAEIRKQLHTYIFYHDIFQFIQFSLYFGNSIYISSL